jgi:hypothetical protein
VGKYDIRSVADRTERALIRLVKPVWWRFASSEPAFVFIAGMQRSGTNMVMEVLDRSLYTDVYHETDPRAFSNYAMRDRVTIHALAERSAAPHFVIKSLMELDQLRNLMDEFAPARAVWIFRGAEETVRSATRSFGNFAARLGRMQQDPLSDGWYGCGMSSETHALLRRLYHPDINEASAAALMWYYRNILFFDQKLEQDSRVCLLRYEKMVADPQIEFPRLFDFLAIPYSPSVHRKVRPVKGQVSCDSAIEPAVLEVCEILTKRFISCDEKNQEPGR